MTRDEFWGLIEAARGGGGPATSRALCEELERLDDDGLRGFQEHLEAHVGAGYTWDLWGAAYLMEGGCSDDGFLYFRYGLVAQGKEVYEAAIDEPDSLADLEDEISDESFGTVAASLYEERTGATIPSSLTSGSTEPEGEEWDFDDEDECRERLPRMYEAFIGSD